MSGETTATELRAPSSVHALSPEVSVVYVLVHSILVCTLKLFFSQKCVAGKRGHLHSVEWCIDERGI